MKKFLIFLFWEAFFLNGLLMAEEPLSSKQLLERSEFYSGKEVVFLGEVIGDLMKRGGYFWINVCDEYGCVGVWANEDLAETIKHTGRYQQKGDFIKIKGVFNYPCKEHLGEADIHAQEINLLLTGKKLSESIDRYKLILALVLLGGLFLLWILRRLRSSLA